MNPLCSEITEKSFIGCVVASNGSVLDSYCPEPEAFFDPAFRTIYSAALAIHKSGGKVSAEAVMAKFEGQIFVGGQNILDVCYYPIPSMAGQFYETLSNWLSLRRARTMAEQILGDVEAVKLPEAATTICQQIITTSASLLPSSSCDNVLDDACGTLEKRLGMLERGEKIQGFRAPITAWNSAFGGICDGNLYALAARPGMGKTALMEQMVSDYIANDIPVSVFEKDMAPNVLIERIACRSAKVPHWKLSRGLLSKDDIAQVRAINDALRETKLSVYNPTNLTPEKMSAIVRRDRRTKGTKAVFLDHIQVLDVGKEKREGLTHASITIRQTVTETGIPHIVLAHINRNGAKGRPSPEDIKEFDQLYGDCDGMAILWSDVDKTSIEPGELLPTNIYFAKNRNGPTGEEPLLFDGALMAFRNAEKPAPQPKQRRWQD